MKTSILFTLSLVAAAAATANASAQNIEFLFTTTQTETTLSGSGGTVLQTIRPNEIAVMQQCPTLAEKWAPRTCFHTMAGDTDGDDAFWEPNMFGQIDALVQIQNTPVLSTNQRTVYWSPRQPMGNVVSGGVGIRPGDVARIVRNTSGDGQVEHFIRNEHVATALGLPPATPLNIDAATTDRAFGVFLSLESNVNVNLCVGGSFLMRDGAVFMIPASEITWNTDATVSSVLPGSALLVYDEPQMNLFVQNAQITNRFGLCVNSVVDVDALDIDWTGGVAGTLTACSGVPAPYPNFVFTGQSLSGGGILTTAFGGSIYVGCAPFGTSCGSGPTFGSQIGLQPPTSLQGIPSSVNALAGTRVCRFVTETGTPVVPSFSSIDLDVASPGPTTWVFAFLSASGSGVVSTSFPFPGFMCFPDYYGLPLLLGAIPTASGFGSLTTPPIPGPTDLIFQGLTVTPGGFLEISTPTTVEVF